MKLLSFRTIALAATGFLLPALAFAQTSSGTLQSLSTTILGYINDIAVPIIFALAFLMFLFGIFRYFIQGGADEEKIATGRRFLIWSLVGFAVMISIWGIINLLVNTIGLNNDAMPCIPTFGSGCSGQNSGNTYSTGSDQSAFPSSSYDSNGNLINSNSSSNAAGIPSSSGTCPTGYGYAQDLGYCEPLNSSSGNTTTVTPSTCPAGTFDSDGGCQPVSSGSSNATTNTTPVTPSTCPAGTTDEGDLGCQPTSSASANSNTTSTSCPSDEVYDSSSGQCLSP